MSSPDVEQGTGLRSNVEGNDVVDTDGEKPVPTRPITGIRWFLFNTSTLTTIFLYALDNTVVANIQPVIVNDFNAVPQLPWLSVGFMIGGLAMVMPLGKLYVLFDPKWLYVIFTIVFLAASALCGGAPNMPAEIVGRVFAGAGGNGMYYGLLILMSVHTTERERPVYLSLTGLIWGLGTVLGPVVGGAFELYTWRWAFYINLLFGAFLVPAYFFLIPSTPGTDIPAMKKVTTFDWTGFVLSTVGFITLVMGINFGGLTYGWHSGSTIALFVVSGLLWIMFAVQQSLCISTTPERRMLPVKLLANREVVLLFVIGCCVGTISYVTVYYMPLYFQFTRGDTALRTAERILPFILPLIVMMLASGYFMSRLGYYKPWYIFGSTCALIGAILMSKIELHTSTPPNYGYQALIAIGAGAYTQAGFAVVQAVVDPKDAGDGVTLMLLAQLCGLAGGLSVAGAVFENLSLQGLQQILLGVPRSQVEQVISGTSGSFIATLAADVQEQVLEVIVGAWQKVFIQIATAAGLSLLLSLFLMHKKVASSAASGS